MDKTGKSNVAQFMHRSGWSNIIKAANKMNEKKATRQLVNEINL